MRLIHQMFLALFVCFVFTHVPALAQKTQTSQKHTFTLTEIANGLDHPWSFAFLPGGDILITERAGNLRIVRGGKLEKEPIKGLPKDIFVSGQGGVLDVALHPKFAKNKLIYISYAAGNRSKAGTQVLRAKLTGRKLEHVEVIFTSLPKTPGSAHYGSRLAFADDGTLFITIGDRYDRLHDAQNPANHLGAVIRINDDGTVPKDNPFIGKAGFRPEIYSYGHRNPQGMALRPSDRSIWLHEHGPRGGDELNKLKPGANFGWPAITYGIDYSGAIISDKTHAPGMEQPVIHWTPSIAPSGMAFYEGDKFPAWKGSLFIGALAKRHLRRLTMKGDKVLGEELLLEGMARFRDVRQSLDGHLYVLTDKSDGQLLRLDPAKAN